ncbi:hypothetical protein BJ973_002971 [Actinoplanes tereljensis]|uniref:Uncharacterized protein n=1 Tax=Paractinoplanes tereljensis TaxID=571912 RepID=A0A919NR00_9ACTN|nr:hypothetical protein [Actinoplanes tereljensis]GIF22650.1 hypothetical protein Ate02nite_53800 [Actinoplanes tereljensis]
MSGEWADLQDLVESVAIALRDALKSEAPGSEPTVRVHSDEDAHELIVELPGLQPVRLRLTADVLRRAHSRGLTPIQLLAVAFSNRNSERSDSHWLPRRIGATLVETARSGADESSRLTVADPEATRYDADALRSKVVAAVTRALLRRVLVLLRRRLRVRVRCRPVTTFPLHGGDHSVHCHRSRAPSTARKTSPLAFREFAVR